MFDTGNMIRVRIGTYWSSPLLYTQVCDGASSASVRGIGDAQYATCKHTDLFVPGFGAVFIAAIKVGQFEDHGVMIGGNLGLDSSSAPSARTTARTAPICAASTGTVISEDLRLGHRLLRQPPDLRAGRRRSARWHGSEARRIRTCTR